MKVLHIGPHKTGSSFLQQQVFPYLKSVNYYGDGDIAENWRKGIRPVAENTPLWSTEAALGWAYPTAEPPRIDDLMALCNDLGISHLLTIKREFPFWVRSIWFQTLNEGGRETFASWYARNAEGLEIWRAVFRDLEQAARKNDVNLKIISYEQLVADAPAVLTEMAHFLGSEYPTAINVDKRTNPSKYGSTFVSTYIFLNSIIRGRKLRKLTSLLRISPRIVMQRSPLGTLLDRISPTQIILPPSLAALDWVDSK